MICTLRASAENRSLKHYCESFSTAIGLSRDHGLIVDWDFLDGRLIDVQV
jgi:hypothetical protein